MRVPTVVVLWLYFAAIFASLLLINLMVPRHDAPPSASSKSPTAIVKQK